MSKKSLSKMTIKERIEELLNSKPKTLFRIIQLIPGIEDGIPDEEDDVALHKLHQAKYVVAGGCAGHIDLGKLQDIEKEPDLSKAKPAPFVGTIIKEE
jgi:hypothetical protein